MTSPERPELHILVGGRPLDYQPADGWPIAVLVHVECGHAVGLAQEPVIAAASASIAERAAANGRTGTARWRAERVDVSDGEPHSSKPVVRALLDRTDCHVCRRDQPTAVTALRHAMAKS